GKAKEVGLPPDIAREVETWRGKLVEAVAETDGSLMERFFETGTLPHEDMGQGLHRAIRERKIFPGTMNAAAHGIGTGSLLDDFIDLAPSPAERTAIPALTLGGEPTEIKVDVAAPVAALVFKTLSDPFTGKVTIFRVMTGTVTAESTLWNA